MLSYNYLNLRGEIAQKKYTENEMVPPFCLYCEQVWEILRVYVNIALHKTEMK